MKNFKEMGITLMALVITIIILLILAGVTIGMATSGTGLFEKAKEATEKYKNAQEEEEMQIGQISNQIESFISGGRDNKVNYSLDKEQVIGTWTDGKNLYQKSFHTTSTIINIEDLNVDNICNIQGIVHDPTYDFPIEYSDADGWIVCVNYDKSSKSITIGLINATLNSADITIQYTKK